MGEISYIVVGVGFNINRSVFSDEISEMGTSLFKETGRRIPRARFLADFLTAFMKRYRRFLKEQNLASFTEEYESHLVNIGRQVKIIKNGEEMIRTALGINDKGELIVQDDTGVTETIFTGEVSVRGLYGYV